ncbi:uncharacterized protein LOC142332206 [Lycorma delicatula]|uniref:uncharacterized protein LOC142332206 n=1 Tax=Lycorma delicatula TaxID=130591 RepID=UPI003F519D7C
MAVQGELPVWVSGQQLWVRGLDKKTTCNDVIKALLGHSDDNYVIIERWRRVERQLGGDTRLLKLWTTWGDAQNEVKLSLRRISADDDSGRGSPTSYARRKKHHHHHHHHSHYKNHHQRQQQTQTQSQTIHPKRLQQLSKTQNIERLLKLILVQGETIQNQLQKLHERDDQIEHLEDETHRARVNMLGSNYVLETYLGSAEDVKHTTTSMTTTPEADDEKENDSGVITENGPSSSENTSNTPTTEDTKEEEEEEEDLTTIEEDIETEIKELQKRIELWEKVLKVNKKLEKEEENLVRLYVSVRRCDELNELKIELDKKRQEIDYNNKELEKYNYTLTEADVALNARRKYLRRLQSELEASDLETEMLLKATDSKNIKHKLKPVYVDFDSNSDTGLSSLHSSSEEGTYVLDTLV